MRSSVVLRIAVCAAALTVGCRREAPHPPPLAAQVDGTIEIDGLSAPVRIVRDRWGIPHVYAQSPHDLFVGQGFVQAEDRLFQMDLWRRSVQGRLSEVLGPNFIERDAMTRRVQYRGDLAREWAGYGPDARSIAEAFVAGVNAWVALARGRPPEAFVLAGWLPEPWAPEDLLNRTDAFDVRAAVDFVAQHGLNEVVADAVRRVGAAPFFTLLAVPVTGSPGSQRPAGGPSRDRELVPPLALLPADPTEVRASEGELDAAESRRRYENPSPRYLIHLHAPGWNVTGATAPWRPGIAIGHNERFAWALAPEERAGVELREVAADPAATRVVTDRIAVKGRAKPFEFQTEMTPEGVVVASDREHGRQFVLQWRGFEAGSAPELAALRIDRAGTPDAMREAAARWMLPAGHVLFVGRDELNGRQASKGTRHAPEERGDAPASARVLFAHPLAITSAARARFDVGPLARPERDQQLRAHFVARDWDRSRAVNAPGQSESPDSPHFADMAALWSAGDTAPLVFSDAAVDANTASVLTLVPRSAATR
jgi:penicillin G amidase